MINLLACALRESEIVVEFVEGTTLAALHPTGRRIERTNCSFGLNPDFAHIASEAGLRISAIDDTGEVRAIERPDHPFFVATLYQPQRSSELGRSHPILDAFVRAAAADT